MTKYAIFWKSLATGATGNGEFIEWPSLEAAKGKIASLNKKYAGEIHHWLVASKDGSTVETPGIHGKYIFHSGCVGCQSQEIYGEGAMRWLPVS